MERTDLKALALTVLAAGAVFFECSRAGAEETPLAAARELHVVVRSVEATVPAGSRLPVTVNVTNIGKRPVRLAWACACHPDTDPPVSHDQFQFLLRLGEMHREVDACDHSGSKIACRRCLPIFTTLVPGEQKEFNWSLDLKTLIGDRTGSVDVAVRYRHEDRDIKSQPIRVAIQNAR